MKYQNKEMKENNIFAKKRLGQNFLINKKISDLIIEKSVIEEFNNNYNNEKNGIIEIGSGLGALTDILINKNKINKIVSIEIDKQLFFYLNKKYLNVNNIKLINKDILKINLNLLIKKEFYNINNIIVISNTPYNITSKIIFKLLNVNNLKIKSFVLMMQKELGDRINAKINTKKYNNFTLLCKFYCDFKKILFVKKNNFFPIPKVDSIVLKFFFNKKIIIKNEKDFLFFIKSMFFNKRKNILNNLKNIYKDKDKIWIKEKLNFLSFNYNLRSENLSLNDFYKIYKFFNL